MKCYVSLNSDDNCVITRLDCKYPALHKKVVSKSEFTTFWYKKMRLERMVRWFQFMADDSICVEWIDLNDFEAKTRECIFILDESISSSGIKDYLKREVAEYFDVHRIDLQTRCDNFENYIDLVEKNEYLLIEAIRKFDETGSLKYIEDLLPLKEVNPIINLIGKKWSRTKVLFSNRNIANKTNNWLFFASLGCVLLVLYSIFFSSMALPKILFSFVSPLVYFCYTRKNHIKATNEMVLQELHKSLADEPEKVLDSNTKIDEPRKEKREHFVIRYTKEISAYMESLPEMDFSNEQSWISSVSEEFPVVATDRDFTVKTKYIIKLLDLAEKIYSKEKRIGLSSRSSKLLSIENLCDYLEFIGFKRENIELDPVFQMLSDTLPIIEDTPFYGCEVSVLRLYKICIKSLIDRSFESESYSAVEAETEITTILEKLAQAEEYSRLQNLKKAILDLSSIPDEQEDPTDLVTESAKRIHFAKKDNSNPQHS